MNRPLIVALGPVLTIIAMSMIGKVTRPSQLFLVLIIGALVRPCSTQQRLHSLEE